MLIIFRGLLDTFYYISQNYLQALTFLQNTTSPGSVNDEIQPSCQENDNDPDYVPECQENDKDPDYVPECQEKDKDPDYVPENGYNHNMSNNDDDEIAQDEVLADDEMVDESSCNEQVSKYILFVSCLW